MTPKRPFADVPLNCLVPLRAGHSRGGRQDVRRSNEAWRGVAAAGEPPPAHEAIRRELKGVVELWPTIKPADGSRPGRLAHAARRSRRGTIRPSTLAGRIAEMIGGWLARRLARARGRRRNRRAPADPGQATSLFWCASAALLRGDDPRAEEPQRQGRRRRPAEAARAHRGDGPRRRRPRGAYARRRPDRSPASSSRR